MARKCTSKSKKATEESFMFPTLHEDVLYAISDDLSSAWFHDGCNEIEPENKYSTVIMGRFRCINSSCSENVWTSGQVSIVITGYPNNGYGAIVYNQRCKSCHWLGALTLDKQSYVDRIAYRLKKWAGIAMEERSYTRRETPPHRADLYEGCKRGVCRQGNGFVNY